MSGNTFKNNIVYSSSSFQNPLWHASAGPQLPADAAHLYYSAAGATISNSVVVDSSPKYGDPQFANPGAGDYAIPASSPAYSQINWQTLPTDQGPLANPL